MTQSDAEQKVRERWPEAYVKPACWTAIPMRYTIWSGPLKGWLAEGLTRVKAWADAAARMEGAS